MSHFTRRPAKEEIRIKDLTGMTEVSNDAKVRGEVISRNYRK